MNKKELKLVNKIIEDTKAGKLIWKIDKGFLLIEGGEINASIPESNIEFTLKLKEDCSSVTSFIITLEIVKKNDEDRILKWHDLNLCRIKEYINVNDEESSQNELYILYKLAKESANNFIESETNSAIDAIMKF